MCHDRRPGRECADDGSHHPPDPRSLLSAPASLRIPRTAASLRVDRGPRGRRDSYRQQMSEQTYDEGRSKNLEALLLALANRIQELAANGELLAHAGELTKLIGDVRSELFHYEVRATYDTPEVADRRRIVAEAKDNDQGQWEKSEWKPEDEDGQAW